MNIRNRAQLIDFINNGNDVKYIFFWGHQEKGDNVSKSCFSQWYEAAFTEDNKTFLTAEHYMMYHKAKLFGDLAASEQVLCATNPGKAKAIGRQVLNFNQKEWDQNCFQIVVNANLAKFSQNTKLREFLLKTGNRILVEASPVDNIWGIGLAKDDPLSENPKEWKGDNLLGFALMAVRDQLTNQQS